MGPQSLTHPPGTPPPRLRHLSLRCSALGDAGARSLGGHLAGARRLVSLVLSFNRISDAGAGAIAEVGGGVGTPPSITTPPAAAPTAHPLSPPPLPTPGFAPEPLAALPVLGQQ